MIPFNKPYAAPKTLDNLKSVLNSNHFSGEGDFTIKSEQILSRIHNGSKSYLTHSGTSALEMASLVIDLRPGDEVILPSFNFTSAATAVCNFGATPVFCDISKSDLGLDPNRVVDSITEKTVAISVVNYAGYSESLFELRRICDEHGLYLIEDNAHGLGGRMQGATLGTVGDVSTLSFHETKNIQAGECGALIINNPNLLHDSHSIWQKGTNRKDFIDGIVEKYGWVTRGSSFLPSEFTAAVLYSQLQIMDEIQLNRLKIWNSYRTGLENWAILENFSLPVIRSDSTHTAHIFYLIAPSKHNRELFVKHLKSNGVQANSHYQPLHNSVAGEKYGYSRGELQVSSDVSERLVRLPLWHQISDDEIQHVIESALTYRSS